MVSRIGARAGCRGSGMSGATLRAKLSAEQEGKREPEDFMRSRVWLMSRVRQRTRASRERRMARSAYASGDR